jgi:hypothetical protein
MLAYGYPGFEHNYGLWFDRRRDAHDVGKRADPNAVPPFLEQPWARSDSGTAWDGLPKYDLEKFNDWYFKRLREFAALSDRKGTILLFNFYSQHPLLEYVPHYVDFPWRPTNTIQATGMPDRLPAANAFYDVSHPKRRELHRLYIRKCLDELGAYSNVVFLLSHEYTGPLEFTNFWLDTIRGWQEENGRRIMIGLGATKDVLDAVLVDPERGGHVSVLDLRYWWYAPDGTLFAPPGGRETPGRYAGGHKTAKTTPERIYEQVLAYRQAFPQRAILHMIGADLPQTWAFLMGGGSLLVRALGYSPTNESEPWKPPDRYVEPAGVSIARPAYALSRGPLAESFHRLRPCPALVNEPQRNWCLADPGQVYLVYARGGGSVELDLRDASGTFAASWIEPSSGIRRRADPGEVAAGNTASFDPPGDRDWLLWVRAAAPGSS